MRVILLYRDKSEQARACEEFIRSFQSRTQEHAIEVIDIDSREGDALGNLYDIVQHPAVLVLQTNGSAQNIWQGDPLPLVDEVIAYARG